MQIKSMGKMLILLLIGSTLSVIAEKMKLTRVILASNENPVYLEFWPLAAKGWKQLIGVQPTLALVTDETISVDESLGDVIRFKPIEGLSTVFQAQIIRLLLPALFPDEVCIVSDIDQVPCNRAYFCDSIAKYNDHCFIVYREVHSRHVNNEIPMCYVAAKGSVFSEIFGVKTMEDIRNKIAEWGKTEFLKYNWITDQRILYDYVTSWEHYQSRVVRFGHDWIMGRLHSFDWPAGRGRLKNGGYIDISTPKPYHVNKAMIDDMLRTVGLPF